MQLLGLIVEFILILNLREKREHKERERRVDQKIKIKPGNIDLECKRYEEKESETKRQSARETDKDIKRKR